MAAINGSASAYVSGHFSRYSCRRAPSLHAATIVISTILMRQVSLLGQLPGRRSQHITGPVPDIRRYHSAVRKIRPSLASCARKEMIRSHFRDLHCGTPPRCHALLDRLAKDRAAGAHSGATIRGQAEVGADYLHRIKFSGCCLPSAGFPIQSGPPPILP